MVQLDENQQRRARDFDAMCVGIIRTLAITRPEAYAAYGDWVERLTGDSSKFDYPFFAQVIGATRDEYIENKRGGIFIWEP